MLIKTFGLDKGRKQPCDVVSLGVNIRNGEAIQLLVLMINIHHNYWTYTNLSETAKTDSEEGTLVTLLNGQLFGVHLNLQFITVFICLIHLP